MRTNAPDDERYERKETKGGGHMFNLKAANGEVIGTNEVYTSTGGLDNGIASVKTNAPDAAVKDLTG